MGDQLDRPYGIKVLFEGVDPVIDLVAVHGLDGGRETTWTADNGALWLRDFLPDDVPNARIISYGYDGRTKDSSQKSCQRLHDHSIALVTELTLHRETTNTRSRPIIFIAHSAGGIILKDALFHSHSANKNNLLHHNAMKTSTYGILFFGTPHQGEDIIKCTRKIFGASKSTKTKTSSPLVEGLSEGSEQLQKQLVQFNHISSDFVTACFYGTYKPMNENRTGSPTIPGAVNVEVLSIHSGQDDMVKYRSLEDDGFRKVSACIRLMAADAPKRISSVWEKWNRLRDAESDGFQKTFNIPFEPEYPRNKHFTGRESILENVQSIIDNAHSSTSDDMAFVILIGLGGAGKTQIASEYVYRHQQDYQSIFWVSFMTKASAEAGFTAIAKRLVQEHAKIAHGAPNYLSIAKYLDMVGIIDEKGGIIDNQKNTEKIIRGVKLWFSNRANKHWLLVLDNVDDLDKITEYVPRATHGTIIMTSRRIDSAPLGTALKIEPMNQEEGTSLFFKSSGLEADDLATKLVEQLGGLPLALVQAGAYIAVRGTPLKKYLEIYEKHFNEVLSKKPSNATWQYGERTVCTTWEISFQSIRETDPEAARLLSLCSFLSNRGIRDDMLQKGMGLGKDDITLQDKLSLLFSYSLASRNDIRPAPSFDIHPLVHLWSQKRLEPTEIVLVSKESRTLIANALGGEFRGQATGSWKYRCDILQHVLATGEHVNEGLTTSLDEADVDNIKAIANFLLKQGRLEESKMLLLFLQERLVQGQPSGADAEEEFRSQTNLFNLAYLLRIHEGLGQVEELEAVKSQVMELMDNTPDGNRKRLMRIMLASAGGEWGSKAHQEIVAALAEQISSNYEELGPNHPYCLFLKSERAGLDAAQGRYKEAIEITEEVLEAKRRVLNIDDPDIFNTILQLAFLYYDAGIDAGKSGDGGEVVEVWRKAEKLSLEAVAMAKSLFGEESRLTFEAHRLLAAVYRQQGQEERMRSVFTPLGGSHFLDFWGDLKIVRNWSMAGATVNTEQAEAGGQRKGNEEEMLELQKIQDSIEAHWGNDKITLSLRVKLFATYLKNGSREKATEQVPEIVRSARDRLKTIPAGDEERKALKVLLGYFEPMLGLGGVEAIVQSEQGGDDETQHTELWLGSAEAMGMQPTEGQGPTDYPSDGGDVERYIAAEKNACKASQSGKGEEDEMLQLREIHESSVLFGRGHMRTLCLRLKLSLTYCEKSKMAKAEQQFRIVIYCAKKELHENPEVHKGDSPHRSFIKQSEELLGSFRAPVQQESREGEMLQQAIRMSLAPDDDICEKGLGDVTGKEATAWRAMGMQTTEGQGSTDYPPDGRDVEAYIEEEKNACKTSQSEKGEADEMLQLRKIHESSMLFGRDHMTTLILRVRLSRTYYEKSKMAKAEQQLRIVIYCAKNDLHENPEVHKEGSPLRLLIKGTERLLEKFRARGQQESREEEMLQQAIRISLAPDEDINEKGLGDVTGKEARAWRAKHWATAEAHGLDIVESSGRILGHSHPKTLEAMARLAQTYTMQSKWDEAVQLQQDIFSGRRESLGPEHPNTLSAMAALATSYWHLSDFANAGILERKVHEARFRILGCDHPDTLSATRNLAATYASQNKYTPAVKLQTQVVERFQTTARFTFKPGEGFLPNTGTDDELLQIYRAGLERNQPKGPPNYNTRSIKAPDTQEVPWMQRMTEVFNWMKDTLPPFVVVSLSFCVSFIFSSFLLFLSFVGLYLITFPLRIFGGQRDLFPRVLQAFMNQVSDSARQKNPGPRERVLRG